MAGNTHNLGFKKGICRAERSRGGPLCTCCVRGIYANGVRVGHGCSQSYRKNPKGNPRVASEIPILMTEGDFVADRLFLCSQANGISRSTPGKVVRLASRFMGSSANALMTGNVACVSQGFLQRDGFRVRVGPFRPRWILAWHRPVTPSDRVKRYMPLSLAKQKCRKQELRLQRPPRDAFA